MSVIDRSQDARQSVGPIGKRRRLAVWTSRRGTHLGSGHVRPRQQTGHMIASDRIHTNKLLQPGGRPHMGPCFRRDDGAYLLGRQELLTPVPSTRRPGLEPGPIRRGLSVKAQVAAGFANNWSRWLLGWTAGVFCRADRGC